MFTKMLPFPFRNHASLIRKTCNLSEIYFSSGPSSSHAVETVQKVDESLVPSAESKAEDRLNKWRIDEKNKFLEIPQAWVSSFDSIEENRLDLIDLHPDVFRTFPRLDILHRNITWQDKYRQMIYIKMLTRAEMPGGHKKPWPQKGLGKARHGSRRSPIWHGGGIAHGIRGPKTFFYMLPDSLRISGLCIALTIKHAQDDLVIVDDLNSLQVDNPEYLENMAAERNWGYSVLFVHENDVAPRNLALALEDLPYFNVMPYYGLNCLSMLKHDTLVISKNALAIVEKRLLEQMHRAGSLRTKFRYIDHKRKLMSEGEHEEDDEMPPFI